MLGLARSFEAAHNLVMTQLSVLDLSPITQGSDAAQSFRNSVSLARHAEALGFNRYWLAEHHGMPGIASAATAVLMGHVAGATTRIRIGAGGIMLPNHSPLVIAEQFGTLASLYPGRIDLGLGRAPGSDQRTAHALRRSLASDADEFPQDVLELMGYFAGDPAQVRAVPGQGLSVPIWILGSSLYGAQLAAALGLPFAFASHFAPQQMMDAIAMYRSNFRPSTRVGVGLQKPHVMLGFNVFAADTTVQAQFLATSMQQAFVNLRSGRPAPLPPPLAGYREALDGPLAAMLNQVLQCSAVGDPEAVRVAMQAFVTRTGADELMVTCAMFDHAARLRSYDIAAQAARELNPAAVAPGALHDEWAGAA